MTDIHETKFRLGGFQAKYLHPLHSFVKYARKAHPLHLLLGSIQIEPAEIGGVYIIALTGHATAIIHDPEGFIEAPAVIDVPDAAFAAAKGIDISPMSFCGDEYDVTVPEWLQPGMVYVYSAGMHISPKMRNPAWAGRHDEFQPALFSTPSSVRDHTRGLDYRLSETKSAAFVREFLAADPISTAEICFNPIVPALFNPLIDVLLGDHPSAIPVHSFRKAVNSKAPMLVTQLTDCPEFVGIWMAMNSAEAPAPFPFAPKASQSVEAAEG